LPAIFAQSGLSSPVLVATPPPSPTALSGTFSFTSGSHICLQVRAFLDGDEAMNILLRPTDNSIPGTVIDLTRSIPPVPPSLAEKLSETLLSFSRDRLFSEATRNSLASGSERDRCAAVRWLGPRLGDMLEQDRVVVTNGTQSAMQLLFEHLVGRDGILLAEELSYGVLPQLAARSHIKVASVALDQDGLDPDHFDHCCRALSPRALYCNPTVQNPTAAIMSHERRVQIVTIARRHGVVIIEDEPLGRLHLDAPAPIASIAPDITWYSMGLTKCLMHGLRIAYLVGPSAAAVDRLVEPVRRLSHWFPAPLQAAIATAWIDNGIADLLCGEIIAESTTRQRIAASLLFGRDVSLPNSTLHGWLRLPAGLVAQEVTDVLREASVLVRPSDLFAISGRTSASALRLSLSSPVDREALRSALNTIVSVIDSAIKSGTRSNSQTDLTSLARDRFRPER
jgi:DNA-binding transcriptional MocR family regulator